MPSADNGLSLPASVDVVATNTEVDAGPACWISSLNELLASGMVTLWPVVGISTRSWAASRMTGVLPTAVSASGDPRPAFRGVV